MNRNEAKLNFLLFINCLCTHAQSRPTLCNPMDCSLPGSSVHGIFQARILEWAAVSFSRGPSWLRDRTCASCIAGRVFTLSWKFRIRCGPKNTDHQIPTVSQVSGMTLRLIPSSLHLCPTLLLTLAVVQLTPRPGRCSEAVGKYITMCYNDNNNNQRSDRTTF